MLKTWGKQKLISFRPDYSIYSCLNPQGWWTKIQGSCFKTLAHVKITLSLACDSYQNSQQKKEITLLNLLLKLSTNFWTQTKGKNNVSLQSILPTIQKSKKFTSQLSNQIVDEFIKTGFVLC